MLSDPARIHVLTEPRAATNGGVNPGNFWTANLIIEGKKAAVKVTVCTRLWTRNRHCSTKVTLQRYTTACISELATVGTPHEQL